MNWIKLFLSLGTAFAVCLLLIPEIIKIANARNMHDLPNERKTHTGKICSFGGVGIFFGFLISTLIWASVDMTLNMEFLLGAVLVMVVVGMRDDFLPLSAFWKLVGQFVAIAVLLIGDIRIFSLYGFLGVYELPLFFSYLVTGFIVIVITNAFNLIDGIDGLAGSVSLIVFTFFGLWFALEGSLAISAMCLAVLGSVGGFLYYNYSPARIFMGDTGSLMLGFLATGLLIIFLSKNAALPTTSDLHIVAPLSLLSALMVYPLFDTIRVFMLRALAGRSPLSPDRNHIHHLLLDIGCSHYYIVGIVIFLNIVFVFIFTFIGQMGYLSDNWLVPIIVLTASSLAIYLHRKVKKRREVVNV